MTLSSAVAELKPQPVFSLFAEIARYPRLSGAEAKIAGYITSLCQKHAWRYSQDQLGNLVIRVPARGRSKAQGHVPVILQAHMDMVGAKIAGSQHDFERDPIQLQQARRVIDGVEHEVLQAQGTTLGADNGIGLALALAAAADSELTDCPPLELVFTVSEEVGLDGALGLDAKQLLGRSLVNLDCFDVGEICIGCASARDALVRLPLELEAAPSDAVALKVTISGLPGGHSGDEIHLDRPSAIVLLRASLQHYLQTGAQLRLSSLSGGHRRNAIAQEASFCGYVPVSEEGRLQEFFSLKHPEFGTLGARFPQARICIERLPAAPQALSAACQRKLLDLLLAIPHGVLEVSSSMPGLTQTSNNIATLETTPTEVRIGLLPRSSRSGAIESMLTNWQHLWPQLGASIEAATSGGAIWEPKPQDPLVMEIAQAYRSTGLEPVICATHGGVECGVIVSKVPGMSAVSIGPSIRSAHSPQECLVIASVEPVWRCLREFLRARACTRG